jgi:hypothetical protein
VRVRRHGHDARLRSLLQPTQEQVGEQERCEVVEGQGALKPVGGDAAAPARKSGPVTTPLMSCSAMMNATV